MRGRQVPRAKNNNRRDPRDQQEEIDQYRQRREYGETLQSREEYEPMSSGLRQHEDLNQVTQGLHMVNSTRCPACRDKLRFWNEFQM